MHDLDTKLVGTERLRAYCRALEVAEVNVRTNTAMDSGANMEAVLKSLRHGLCGGANGDFLAYRLKRYFAVNENDFHGPPLARQLRATATLNHKQR